MLSIVTGASRGIGFETALELAKNPKNTVLAVTRNPAAISKAIKRGNMHNLLAVKADISTEKGIAAVAKIVKQIELPVQVLVNNAGQLVKKPVEKITLSDLASVYTVNVFAPFLLIKALLPFMSKPSHIVNISSMGGFQGSSKFAGLSAYSSSKGALTILSECLAEEFKGREVSVNCLAIGSVQTEMLNEAFPGFRAPLAAHEMAAFIADFSMTAHKFFNGKVLPVSSTTP